MFTQGSRSGPLVVLRVPDEDAMPEGTSWGGGDLPGTTIATPADIMRLAEGMTWLASRMLRTNKQKTSAKEAEDDTGAKGTKLVRTHPPERPVNNYITQMRGEYSARPLVSIARVPPMDDVGDINFIHGYDPETGLYHDQTPVFDVPADPSSVFAIQKK